MPMSRGRTHVAAALAAVLLAIAVSGCATSRTFRRGEEFARAGDWDSAAAYYTRALQENPDRPDYKIALERAMQAASNAHLDKARESRSEGRARERAGRVPQGPRVRARQLARHHAARRARTAAAREGRRLAGAGQDRRDARAGPPSGRRADPQPDIEDPARAPFRDQHRDPGHPEVHRRRHRHQRHHRAGRAVGGRRGRPRSTCPASRSSKG